MCVVKVSILVQEQKDVLYCTSFFSLILLEHLLFHRDNVVYDKLEQTGKILYRY